MAGSADAKDLKCPLCRNSLARDEYNSALREMKKRAESKADERLAAEKKAHKDRMEEIKDAHRQELDDRRADQKNALAEQRIQLLQDQKQLRYELKQDSDAQLREVKKQMADIRKESDARLKRLKAEMQRDAKAGERRAAEQEREARRSHLKEVASRDKTINDLKKSMRAEHSADLQEKNKEISNLRKEIGAAETAAKKKARLDAGEALERQRKAHGEELAKRAAEIQEKDITLERVRKELDEVKEKLHQRQPELMGEAGERDLRRVLEEAFPHDRFERQKRGTASSDLIQHVALQPGRFGMPIVYDNKAGAVYSKADIKKAAGYKRAHGTEYSLIVSSKPQKRTVPNGLLGEVEGVIVVHPDIVVEVAKTIREGILKIARMSASQEDMDAKQARLYRYVVGHEFADVMRSLESADKEMDELQVKEEKAHKILWDRRKAAVSKQRRAHADLSGGIDAIIQSEILEEPVRAV